MKRVLVVGLGGAGKTTIATPLAATIGAPVVELDRIAWRDGRSVPLAEVEARLAEEVAADRWVVDGTLPALLQRVALGRADHVVWVDTPVIVAASRVVRRGVRRWLLPAGYLFVIARRVRREATSLVAAARAAGVETSHLRTPAEATTWLTERLQAAE